MKDFVEGKRIIVTGSSSGIGLETARVLSEQGAEVLGVDVTSIGDALQEGRQLEYLQGSSYRMMILGRKRILTGALAIGEWPEGFQIYFFYV